MSDNKLSETLAKILIGKSIVSGLKPEPDYEDKKCFECGHVQRVPLVRIEKALCHKCDNNLDTQVKPPAPPEPPTPYSINSTIAGGILLFLTCLFMLVVNYQDTGTINNLFGYFLIFASAFFGLGIGIAIFRDRVKTEKKMRDSGYKINKLDEVFESHKESTKQVLYLIGKYILFLLLGFIAILITAVVFPYSLIWLVPFVVYSIYWVYLK